MTLCGLKKWLTAAALAVLSLTVLPATSRADDNGVFLYLLGLAQPPKPMIPKPIASPCCPHELCRGAATLPCCPVTMSVIVIRDGSHTPAASYAVGCGLSAARCMTCPGMTCPGMTCCQQPSGATHGQAIGRFAGPDCSASGCCMSGCAVRCGDCPLCAGKVASAEQHRAAANQEQLLREMQAMLADLQREITALRVELQVLRQQQPVIVPLMPQQLNVPFPPNGVPQPNFPPMPGNGGLPWNGPMPQVVPMPGTVPGALTPMTPAPMNYVVPTTTSGPMKP